MLKYGKIDQVDASKGTARVIFDENGITSPWLPIIIQNSKENKDEGWLDEGEHVCVLMDNESQTGIIIGAIYDENNLPQIGNPDIWRKKFKDGFELKYNRATHVLNIVDGGNNANIQINCQRVTVTPVIEAKIEGNLVVTGNVNCNGNMTANDFAAGLITLTGHKHPETGTTTGPAIP